MISQGMTRRWSKAARGVLCGPLRLGVCHAESFAVWTVVLLTLDDSKVRES
jgi:hypothetical protein